MRRALFFALGLVVLWVAVQLMPAPRSSDPSLFSDDSGTVAVDRPPDTRRPSVAHSSPSLWSPGYLAALALLGGGVVLAVYLRRKSGGAGASDALIRPIGQLHLAPNQQLRLVACGGDVLLLGVTSGQITLLKSFPADVFSAATDAEDAASSPADPVPGGFADLLQQHAGRWMPAQEGASS